MSFMQWAGIGLLAFVVGGMHALIWIAPKYEAWRKRHRREAIRRQFRTSRGAFQDSHGHIVVRRNSYGR